MDNRQEKIKAWGEKYEKASRKERLGLMKDDVKALHSWRKARPFSWTMWLRHGVSMIVDVFASLLPMIVVVIPLVSYNEDWWPLVIFGIIAAPVYLMFADGFHGAGIGKRLLGLRVIDIKSGKVISYKQSVSRVPYFFLTGSVIEGIYMVISGSNQSLSDRYAGTKVVLKKDVTQ